jgi:O-acetyl-ADP-ribose deacetylase (regulator of RNase III)
VGKELENLSAGIYGYPKPEVVYIALKTSIDYLKEHGDIELVCFVLFDHKTYEMFTEELKELL